MHAAIVCGLGLFGASAARRIERELGSGPLAAAVCLAVGDPSDPDHVAAEIMRSARRLLAHERIVRARDAAGEDGLTELLVIVIASAGEEVVRASIADVLERIETRLMGELGPIFEPFRTGSARNAVVLPLLSMPHPSGDGAGDETATAVRALVARVRARPADRRCTPQIFLVEDVAEYSILSERELEQNVRNFVTLLLRARPGLRELSSVIHGHRPEEPLATFACAVAELPRARLDRWGKNRVALEVLDAVLDAKLEGATMSELDALEDVELQGLDVGGDAAHVVRDLLERYAPPIDPDAPPTWWERAEAIRERYGPDHGDPSLDDAQPPPDPPIGFALDRMRAIEDAWRLLQRRRFDDLVARERASIETARDGLLERIGKRVDRELWSSPSPSPEAFRRATELVSKMRRAVASDLEEAIAERDAARPSPAPSFEGFRATHATLLDAARRKPDLATMAFWGVLALLFSIALGPTMLYALADAIGSSDADWYDPLLRAHGEITSGLLAFVIGSGVLAWRVRERHVDAVEAHGAMWRALQQTVHGGAALGTSVLQYFASRLRLARLTARIEALLAVRATLDRDAETLQLSDRAAKRARAALKNEQRELGAMREDGRDDPARLLGGAGETLVEPLTDPSAALAIERQLPIDGLRSRVADGLRALADREGWARSWREQVPFSSIDALRATVAPHAEPISAWDPFAEGPDADATARRIASFVRRQARSLHVALDFSGREASSNEARPVYSGVAIIPPAAYEPVRRLLAEEGAGGRGILPCERGVEPDRAYYLVVVTDIACDRVASLRARHVERAGAVVPPFVALAPASGGGKSERET